eukprot:3327028-Pleurochrysis_carterae.AAC.1
MRSVCTPDAVASAATLPTSVVMLWASSMTRKVFGTFACLPVKRLGQITSTSESNVVLMRTELLSLVSSSKMNSCRRSWSVVVMTLALRI